MAGSILPPTIAGKFGEDPLGVDTIPAAAAVADETKISGFEPPPDEDIAALNGAPIIGIIDAAADAIPLKIEPNTLMLILQSINGLYSLPKAPWLYISGICYGLLWWW